MSHLTHPFRVLVIGGGLGGLTLAQGLCKAGISVAVYERDLSPAARSQGYRFHLDQRGEQALSECLPPTLYELVLATRGQPSTGGTIFTVVDGQLKELTTWQFPPTESGEFVTIGTAVDRLVLRQILLCGLEEVIHFGKAFTRYDQQPDGTVRAFFADGTDAVGDVLVAADGVGSRVREQFLPHARLIDTGTRWLGGKTTLTPELKNLLPPQLAKTFGFVPGIGQAMVFGLVSFRQNPDQAARHLVPELHFHECADYLFWGLLARQEQLAVSDDELSALSGPDLRQLILSSEAAWPMALRLLVEQCQPDHTFVLSMRHATPIEPWQTTNVTLLGDAIHAMPPRGSGANTALRDASLLARHLTTAVSQGTSLHQALHDYESQMIPYGFEALQASLHTDVHGLTIFTQTNHLKEERGTYGPDVI